MSPAVSPSTSPATDEPGANSWDEQEMVDRDEGELPACQVNAHCLAADGGRGPVLPGAAARGGGRLGACPLLPDCSDGGTSISAIPLPGGREQVQGASVLGLHSA